MAQYIDKPDIVWEVEDEFSEYLDESTKMINDDIEIGPVKIETETDQSDALQIETEKSQQREEQQSPIFPPVRKKETRSRLGWTADMENLLIDLWQENIEDMRGKRKNAHVYMEMAATLKDSGFEGRWYDIRTKMDNITRKYRHEKQKIGPSGRPQSTWKCYEQVDKILRSSRMNSDKPTLDNNNAEESFKDDPDVSCCSSSNNTEPPAMRSVPDYHAELVQIARERLELQREHQRLQREQKAEHRREVREHQREVREHYREVREHQREVRETLRTMQAGQEYFQAEVFKLMGKNKK